MFVLESYYKTAVKIGMLTSNECSARSDLKLFFCKLLGLVKNSGRTQPKKIKPFIKKDTIPSP